MPSRSAIQRMEFGLYLLIPPLAMGFLAALGAYLRGRLTMWTPSQFPLQVPTTLWWSTAFMLLGSWSLHRAVQAVRRERQLQFRRAMYLAIAAGGTFVVLQCVAMTPLLRIHWARVAEWQEERAQRLPATQRLMQFRGEMPDEGPEEGIFKIGPSGTVVLLIALHVVHLLAAIAILAVVAWQGLRGRFDHEYYSEVKLAAVFWHFLDIVWILIFGTLLLTA